MIIRQVVYCAFFLLLAGTASLRAQDFGLYAQPANELKYDSLLGMYTSTLSATPPGSDSIWYYLNCPDNVSSAPVVTLQLNGPPTFMLLYWYSNDSIIPFPINTPVDLQTEKFFATSFFVGWDARPHIDTAFLTISDMTDTVVVRIIAKPVGLWLAYDPVQDSVFDSILVGTTACRDYKLHNYTGSSVAVTGLRVDGIYFTDGQWQKGSHFSVSGSPPLPHTIANEDSMSFSICYTPPVVAIDNGTLKVFAGDSLLAEQLLIGTSFAPADVKRISEEDRASVFPNPSTSRIYISGIPDGDSFAIIDALGRQVVRGALQSDFIDITGCSAGLYTIFFRTGERASFIKLER